jgi:peptide/nickel transport system substrate-binding protein
MGRNHYWSRLRRGRISRRRLLAATGAGAAGLAVAAACGGGGDDEPDPEETAAGTPTQEAGTPKRGGTYKSAVTADWGTLDPLVCVSIGTGVLPRLYNVLLDRSRTQPDFWFFDLADDVEQPDEETYNFSIRPGVKIAPNDLGIPERDMDAFDTKAWLERVGETQGAVHHAFTVQWLSSYDAPDASNFQIKTKGPYSYFFFRIGLPMGGTIPPREFYEQEISLADKAAGAGPYVVRPGSYAETGGLIIDRNPNYYRIDEATGEQLPYIDTRESYRITDRLARRTAFLDGQIYSYTAEDSAEKDEILRQVSGAYATETPVNTYVAFMVNPTRPPWDDERIRKAALYALDRQEYVDRIVGPDGGKPNGIVHWPLGSFALDPEELEELQPYDPQRSRQLIKEATGQDTVTIKVSYPLGIDIQYIDQHLPIWKQQMRDAGFDLDEQAMDFGTWLDGVTRADYDATLTVNQTYETAEIPLDWQSARGPQGDGGFSVGIGALYPEVEEAITNSKQTSDPEEHIKRVLDTQRLIYDKGPGVLPIMSYISYTIYQPFVKNPAVGLGGTGSYVNTVWLDL